MKISRFSFLYLALILLLIFDYFIEFNHSLFPIRESFITLFLLTIPGIILLFVSNLQIDDFWENLVYSVGFSLFFLMFVGISSNTFYSLLNIAKPLSSVNLLKVFNIELLAIAAINFFRKKEYEFRLNLPHLSKLDVILFFIIVALPVLAVAGAISLNNNSINYFTPVMLFVSGLLVAGLFFLRSRISRNFYPIALFSISLSLLLMTSLRGWYTTGHDNQLEYFVFQLAKSDLKWNMAEYRDPYNASFSITILPTVFYSFLISINDVYIFKIIFQVIFAFTSISIFILFEKYASAYFAFLATFLFLSFPTFINDMPMLNRQEIAMFFLSLLYLRIFNSDKSLRFKRLPYYAFALGMILSHYSTTYITIAGFTFVYICYLLLRYNFVGIRRLIKINNKKPKLKFEIVASLIIITFLWNVQLTNTTQGLTRVIGETYKNLNKVFSQDLKSGGVLYSLFSYKSLNRTEALQSYIEKNIEIAKNKKSSERLYSSEITQEYPLKLIDEYKNPQSTWVSKTGINAFDLNFIMRQAEARILQLFMIIGGVVILFRKSKLVSLNMNTEYFIIIFANILTLGVFIFLPVLSIEYGTQRLFQQALMVTSLPLIIGFAATLGFNLTVLVVVILFWSLSGFLPLITGGYYPQLHLENAGAYYETFLTHKSEVVSMKWIRDNFSSRYDIYANSSSHSKFAAVAGMSPEKSIIPQVLTTGSYVYLDYTNTKEGKDIETYNGDLIIYTYPTVFLDENKDLIYTNSQTRVYK